MAKRKPNPAAAAAEAEAAAAAVADAEPDGLPGEEYQLPASDVEIADAFFDDEDATTFYNVFQIKADGKRVYRAKYTAAAFRDGAEARILQDLGSGDFIVTKRRGKYNLRSRTLSVEAGQGLASPVGAPAAGAPPDPTSLALLHLRGLAEVSAILTGNRPAAAPGNPTAELQAFLGGMKACQEMREQIREEVEEELAGDEDDDPQHPAAPAPAAPPAAAATEAEPESQEAGPEIEAVLVALDALEVPPVWKKIAKTLLPALLRKPDRKDLAVQYLAAYANGQIQAALLAQTIRTEAAAKYSRQLAKLVDEHPAVVARLVGLIDEQLGAFYATEAGQTKIRELQAVMKGGGS